MLLTARKARALGTHAMTIPNDVLGQNILRAAWISKE